MAKAEWVSMWGTHAAVHHEPGHMHVAAWSGSQPAAAGTQHSVWLQGAPHQQRRTCVSMWGFRPTPGG